MRICFSLKIIPNQPGGGGAKFTSSFADYMSSQGHSVEYFFKANDPPDCVFFLDHKLYSDERTDKWIGLEEARAIKLRFPNLPIVTRVNDIGAPKDRAPDFVQRFTELANLSDHVIFISKWLRDDYYKNKINSASTVIHNSVDKDVFTIKPYREVSPKKFKLFTHHWSPSRIKGWGIYEQIDKWIKDKDIDFTFVGNLPNGVNLKNSTTLKPLAGLDLAEEIKKHDIYVTASEFEPCGMHHIEGIACGLPYLYTSKGGGTRECGQFGLEFGDFEDFKEKLKKIIEKLPSFYNKIRTEFELYNKNYFPKYQNIIENV
ncbi:hypothetical protein CMI37_16080 [Candidatus Pacearchaeota archaeon]|nr:hypothetical protein [Candidatus Pacearchaeota archaeon]